MVAAADSKESASASTSVIEGITKEKVSRRSFLKGTIAVAAVAGVSGAVVGKSRLSSSATAQVLTQVDPFAAQTITLNVNGQDYQVSVEPRDMLVNVVREQIGLIGTKRPCNRMECGGCTVLIDGVTYNSCQYLALRAGGGKKIITTEAGVSSTATGAPPPDPVVSALHGAFVENDGGQCGFCSPGQIMSAAALLKQNPNPTVDEIKAAQSGNICRCGNYPNIIASIQLAAKNLGGA